MLDVYLDVDGVLNAFSRIDLEDEWGKATRIEANGYIIYYAPELIEALNDLPLNIIWLTTWEERALPLADQIGLRHSGVYIGWTGLVNYGEDMPGTIHYKWQALSSLIAGRDNSEVLWVDDELIHFPQMYRQLGAHGLGTYNMTGISRTDVELITELAG